MRGPKPVSLHVTSRQRMLLEQIVRRSTSAQRQVTRAKIILAAADGENNQHVADRLDLHLQTARTWRGRWAEAAERFAAIEAEDDEVALREAIHAVLSDDPRGGAPATFTPEQICHIVAVGCERPEDSGRPVSHWTPTELTDEVIKRGLVPSISPRSVGRFLKGKPISSPISLATG